MSGPAVGQGAAMLYHCDLVFAGEHALFSMPGLALGQTPRYGVSLLAVKSGGYKLAAQKLLLSEPISAAEAVAMGLVNHVVEDDKVMTVAGAAALRLACLPPEAMVASSRSSEPLTFCGWGSLCVRGLWVEVQLVVVPEDSPAHTHR